MFKINNKNLKIIKNPLDLPPFFLANKLLILYTLFNGIHKALNKEFKVLFQFS